MHYLLFLPSVTFGLLTAEIFPWALLYCALFLRRARRTTLMLVAMLTLSGLATTATSILQPRDTDVLRSLAAYLNVVLVFECVLNLPGRQLKALQAAGRTTFFVLLGVGLLQTTSVLAPVEDVISFLVPRARASALTGQGGRGVTLLASEPARAGIELTFLYMLVRVRRREHPAVVLWDVLMLGYVVFVIKSASAAAFCLLVVMLLAGQRPIRVVFWSLAIFAGLVLPSPDAQGRTVIFLNGLAQFRSFGEIVFFVANESGHRLLALYSFVLSGLVHPLGSGVGNWANASVSALQDSGIPYGDFRYFQIWSGGDATAVRAPGVLPNMMLDIGIVGTAYCVYWIRRRSQGLRCPAKMRRVFLGVLLAKITLFGSLGNPIPWVVVALLLRLQASNVGLVPPTGGSEPEGPLHAARLDLGGEK